MECQIIDYRLYRFHRNALRLNLENRSNLLFKMVTIGIRAFSCIYLVVMHMNNSARYIRILEIIFIVVLWLNSYHKNGLFSVALLAFSSIKTYDLLLNFELPFCRSFSKMCLSQLWYILYEFISHYVGLIHFI